MAFEGVGYLVEVDGGHEVQWVVVAERADERRIKRSELAPEGR